MIGLEVSTATRNSPVGASCDFTSGGRPVLAQPQRMTAQSATLVFFMRYSRAMTMAMASCSGGEGPRQGVLVLQSGGALRAYQVGVLQGPPEAGAEPHRGVRTPLGRRHS